MRKSVIYYFGVVMFALVISCNDFIENSVNSNYNYKNIDLFTVVSYRTLKSFQIDSTGKILEYFRSSEQTRVYSYNLNKIEKDSLKLYLNLIYLSDENTITNELSSCVHGVTYQITINTKDGSNYKENIICDDKNIVDEMVLYILDITENKNKELMFENYIKYQNFLKNTDSILNIKTYFSH